MIAELGISPQLSAMVASEEARIKKSAISSEKKGLEKTHQLTNAPTDVIQSSEVQKENCIEGRVEVLNGDRVIHDIGVYKCRTKAEEYRMLADLNNCPQVATMVAFEATMMNNTERSKNTRTEDNQISAEPDRTPKAKDSSYFNIVALPDTSKINPQKNEGMDNINSTKLSEAQNGGCSEVVEEDKTGGRNKKGVISDGSINRDNYVYRTKAQEYKMIAELGISPQLSAMVASEDKMKKCAKRIEKGVTQSSEVQNKNCIEGVVEVTNVEAVKPVIGVYKYRTKAEEYRMLADLSNCSQDAAMFACEATMMDNRKTSNNKGTEENQNSADCIKQESRTRYSRAKGLYNHEVKGHFAGKNGEYNKAGQCAHESTTVDRSFSEKEIIPNFVYAPLKSDQGVPSNQGQRKSMRKKLWDSNELIFNFWTLQNREHIQSLILLIRLGDSQYTCAVDKEDYENAVRLQVEITAATQNDAVGRVMSNQNLSRKSVMRMQCSCGIKPVQDWKSTRKKLWDSNELIFNFWTLQNREHIQSLILLIRLGDE